MPVYQHQKRGQYRPQAYGYIPGTDWYPKGGIHETTAPSWETSKWGNWSSWDVKTIPFRLNNQCHGQCRLCNHETKDCKVGQNKCGICNQFGHNSNDCYSKKAKELKRKREKGEEKGDGKEKKKKKKKKEEMNQGEEIDDSDDKEHIVCYSDDSSAIVLDESKEGYNLPTNQSDVYNSHEYNLLLIYYDWLSDSATTSHVSNKCDAFKTFQPLTGTTVSGVGDVKTEAKGWGTVELKSSYQGHNYILELKNVLYILTNWNNLISLGRWDKAGGKYTGGGGALIFITKDGKLVTQGPQIGNNLYKMVVTVCELTTKFPMEMNPQIFVTNKPAQNWETGINNLDI